MPQTSVPSTLTKAFAGMKGESRKDGYDRSAYNSEASAEVPFGVMVAVGAADDAALLLVDANSKFAGVVVHSHAYDRRVDFGDTGLLPKTTLSVMRKGSIWVTVEEAVSVGDVAFVRHTAGAGGTQKGAFRKSADTATAVTTGTCKFLTSASASGLALLDVNL
jgi:hypothetical protein